MSIDATKQQHSHKFSKHSKQTIVNVKSSLDTNCKSIKLTDTFNDVPVMNPCISNDLKHCLRKY